MILKKIMIFFNPGVCCSGLDALDKSLHKELNECFMFHGTVSSSVEAIARLGLDIRLSRDTALYGRGIYLAESPDKAFMYTGKLAFFDDAPNKEHREWYLYDR